MHWTGWPSPEWSLGFGSWFNNFVYSGAEKYTPKDLASINKLEPKDYTNNTDKIVKAAVRRLQDRTTLVLGGIGWYWKRFQGAVDGINLALLYAIYHVNFSKKYLNPITPDVLELTGREKYETVEDAEFGSEKLFQFIKKKLESMKNQKPEEENKE
uniref:MICOS complex subunit MIC13 n=1 Tax=Meloidogyne hapla TaxID=6305 RepID=A0A1I8BBX8_MELHA